ncbi:major facilitator superfamily domain-containing protein [Boeremia exigua]|uniref:major facilitator superfamily domain-containing protein n=1 Tax=Boeremia exigua TaxID=749465 RepID=UPI001E8CB66C|nr:major facilitator superfamily domain-containing protein [Boeremia exigua]KAH6641941.1 major facilitator superfamily domain-containing protein [Boeremia exigua]
MTASSASNLEKDPKPAIEHLEDGPSFSEQETRKLLRKLDWAILPIVAVMYLLSFLDRSNIGNARLAGLEADLGMTGWNYATAVAVFFPFYIISEVPSNLAMKRFRPSIWIPSIMVTWGVVTTLMGIVDSFGGLLGARMALGLAEGGLFPGVAWYITMWYRRHECGLRISIFFSAATIAGAFGGLLARGIMEMDGIAGVPGWGWIFILEGILTVLVACIAYVVLNDFPDTAKFLNPREKAEVIRRLREDTTALSDDYRPVFVKDAFTDWKIWVNCLIALSNFLPLYSVSIFLPTIIRSMGHSNEKAQLMSVPPYILACIATVGAGFVTDRHHRRGIYIIGIASVAIVGFIILITVQNNAVKYFACFLVVTGIYANVPQLASWNSNNIGGSVKRGVGVAMQIGSGNVGGAVAGFIFQAKDAPHYRTGHGILIAMCSLTVLLATGMTLYLQKENTRRDAQYKAPAEYTQAEMELESQKGDNATFFRYTI